MRSGTSRAAPLPPGPLPLAIGRWPAPLTTLAVRADAQGERRRTWDDGARDHVRPGKVKDSSRPANVKDASEPVNGKVEAKPSVEQIEVKPEGTRDGMGQFLRRTCEVDSQSLRKMHAF